MTRKVLYLLLTTFFYPAYAQDNGPSNDGDASASNEVIDAISLDASNILTITEAGSDNTVDLSSLLNSVNMTPIVTSGNDIATHNGASATTIKETITTLIDNGAGGYNFTNEAGVITTIASGSSSSNGMVPVVSDAETTACFLDLGLGDTTNVIINGDFFDTNTTISIAGQTVNSFTLNSSSQITANVTIDTPGVNSDITVTNLAGTFTKELMLALFSHTYSVSDMTLSHTTLAYDGNELSGIGPGVSWSRSAYSTAYKIPLGEPGRLDFISNSTVGYMIGLNDVPAAELGYSSLDYAVYNNVAAGHIIENGAVGNNKTTNTVGSTYSIQIHCDGTVTYLKDNAVYYTGTTTPTGDLYFDSTFTSAVGASVTNIVLSNMTP